MEEWYNRCGGYSRDSSAVAPCIDKTLVCNENSREILVNYFKRNEQEIKTVYIGVDEKKYDPNKYNKTQIKKEFGIEENDTRYILGYICRIDLPTSELSRQNALALAKKAYEKEIAICFDFNFCSSLNDEEGMASLVATYNIILPWVTIAFGSLRDLKELLKIAVESEEAIVESCMLKYNISVFAGTYRHQNNHQKQLQGFIYQGSEKMVIRKNRQVWRL